VPLQLAVPQVQGKAVFLVRPWVFAQAETAVLLQVLVRPTQNSPAVQEAVPQSQAEEFALDPSTLAQESAVAAAEQALLAEVQ